MTWVGWVAIAAGVLAVAAIVIAVMVYREQNSLHRRLEAGTVSPAARGLAREVDEGGTMVAFVANPSKPEAAELREAVRRTAAELGVSEPMWLETTIEDPGVGQTRAAVDAGADVVVAVGGDGTVRAVAEGLIGTSVPMGLVPIGTGNLLARNLDLPLGDPLSALRIALTGRDRSIDVGWLRVLRFESDVHDKVAEAADERPADPDAPRDHIFLVIAGLGFDAAMVAATDPHLKAKMGWIAYFVAGIKHLRGDRTRVHVRVDGERSTTARLRSLLVGNCGRLPGGLTLLPDAELDDGWLDLAAIDARGGIAGWAQLFGEVVLQGFGVSTTNAPKIGRIDHRRAKEVQIVVPAGEFAQVDGEIVGRVVEVAARVDPGALVVRVAALQPQTSGV
ncbi:diacylglycerol/lipid kinase family protein [Cellulomonas edaphi]|uniref:Diacylglycerol kinase family protein n=1 Tax=Cellulomonas edaphi TaxID=3053468 RepID=A0ABT7S3U9_9CELL|nr:diacylglycerol kinase family protein [Cellulomons edaphi]MDM7830295.1 diacylglycerol kinase family protein [Cellulomons edaphi]